MNTDYHYIETANFKLAYRPYEQYVIYSLTDKDGHVSGLSSLPVLKHRIKVLSKKG